MKLRLLLLVSILFFNMNIFSQSTYFEQEVLKQTKAMTAFCRDLHQNPELSLQEFETSKKMAAELRIAGFEVTENFGGNNVVGVLKNGEGPVIMLRTDMDALPVEEKTNLVFASSKKVKTDDGNDVSVMHACGHDIHMSVWAGTIHTLAALKMIGAALYW